MHRLTGAFLFLPMVLGACGGGGGGASALVPAPPIFTAVASQADTAPTEFQLDEVVPQRVGGGVPSSAMDDRSPTLPFLRTRFPVEVQTLNPTVGDAPTFRERRLVAPRIVLNPEYFDSSFAPSAGVTNHLERINVLPAYQDGWTGKGVTIGVIDTPLSLGHKELMG